MTVILTEQELATVIKGNRKKSGLSQLELAELAGVGKTLVFKLEKGQANTQLGNLLKVLRVLNIKLCLEAPE